MTIPLTGHFFCIRIQGIKNLRVLENSGREETAIRKVLKHAEVISLSQQMLIAGLEIAG